MHAIQAENSRHDLAVATGMITGPQISAARAPFDRSAFDLTQAAGGRRSAIHRAERAPGVSDVNAPNLREMQRALETAGVAIIDADGTMGAGARRRQP
jgi:hypothetical protein